MFRFDYLDQFFLLGVLLVTYSDPKILLPPAAQCRIEPNIDTGCIERHIEPIRLIRVRRIAVVTSVILKRSGPQS